MSTPLTDAELTDARRFLGYPLYGSGFGDPTANRYYSNNILLEYRLANMQDAELAVARSYLGTLNTLEVAIPASGDNLSAAQAASYVHNAQEVRDRVDLLAVWVGRFAAFLGVPVNNISTGSIRLVV